MIKLSVVIPTFNRRKVLERTIPALLSQDISREEYEIIVVIDGSTDGTAELLRQWSSDGSLRVLETPKPNLGAGAARNVGIQAATGELVLFWDDDFIAPPDLLRQHCAAHANSDPIVAFGPIYVAPGSSQTVMRYVTELRDEEWYRNLDPNLKLHFPEAVPSILTITVLSFLVNASVPRETLLRAGGFDEEFLAAEDRELGLRLWKMGVQFRYWPAAAASELYVKSAQQHLKIQAREMDGDLRISRKHPEHRPYSVLSGMAETGGIRKRLRKALALSAVSPVPLLSLLLLAEKQLCRFSVLRKLGVRLLSYAERIERLRVAVASTGSWNALESEFGRSLPVLMYHHIGPRRSNTHHFLTVSPEQFEREIRWLARRGYVGVRPSDWLRWRREGKGLSGKPILITFDDAYRDTAEFALPILRRYGFGAAIFVVTGQFGGTNSWDEAEGCGTLQLMTMEQIRYWAGQGIEFGAHSQTHPHLTRLSPVDCANEVVGSKNDLSALLGSPVCSFAYPYGDYNETIHDLVQREFDLAFTADEGLNYLRGDPHLLRRAYVGPEDSLIEFALSVRWGGIQKFRELRAKFRVRSRLKRALRVLLHPGTNICI